MNEFVEQFLLESREHIAQATEDLLALEHRPDDRNRIDGVFRAFHTLKGAAGIVEFAAMGRALHAAENVLSEIRSMTKVFSPSILTECLKCLDQVTRWLDAMEVTGEPPAHADGDADEIVRGFTVPSDLTDPEGVDLAGQTLWLDRLLANHPELSSESLTALRYRPDPDAFFRGEDPLALVADLPNLLAIDLVLRDPNDGLDAVNPFSCGMDITALVAASAEATKAALGPVVDQIEIRPLQKNVRVNSDQVLVPMARSILDAQILLLRQVGRDGAGRLVAGARVAINVFRHAGLISGAAAVEAALARAQNDGDDATVLVAAIEHALEGKQETGSTEERQTAPAPAASTARVLRVDMERIDALVNLTGELTVVKNALGHIATLAQEGVDPKAVAVGVRDQHILFDRLVGELQRSVLRIRVLPLRQVFQRFPRVVRELGLGVGKSIRLRTVGDSTEADTTIVESLFEPLLHVVRNAVDHGVEDARQRSELGKSASATIVLRASRQLENVIVEVEDDGRGVDVERVRAVAAARGVVDPQRLAEMGDREVIDLIFSPGFSTAAKVTGLSGRGVGMDSVRTAVERLGGRVTVESQPNQGTLVRLTLPFTVMMTRVMTVESAGQVFGLPLDTVVETAMVERARIVPIGAAEAFVLRDRTVPLINLAESLGLRRQIPGAPHARIVITSLNGQLGGLEVERLGERMDVMLKPIDGLLGGMRGVAGTTLLGDGRVLIVLDVQELFH